MFGTAIYFNRLVLILAAGVAVYAMMMRPVHVTRAPTPVVMAPVVDPQTKFAIKGIMRFGDDAPTGVLTEDGFVGVGERVSGGLVLAVEPGMVIIHGDDGYDYTVHLRETK